MGIFATAPLLVFGGLRSLETAGASPGFCVGGFAGAALPHRFVVAFIHGFVVRISGSFSPGILAAGRFVAGTATLDSGRGFFYRFIMAAIASLFSGLGNFFTGFTTNFSFPILGTFIR